MASLYRKSKVLEFEDGEKVTVSELEVSILLLAQRGEIELSDEVLIRECTGLEKDRLSLESYNEILSTIDDLHSDLFEQNKESKEDDESSKKNSLS